MHKALLRPSPRSTRKIMFILNWLVVSNNICHYYHSACLNDFKLLSNVMVFKDFKRVLVVKELMNLGMKRCVEGGILLVKTIFAEIEDF